MVWLCHQETMIREELVRQYREIMQTDYGDIHQICVFDQIMRHDGIAEELLKMVEEKDAIVICSGKFGEIVKKVFSAYEVIHVCGGLREADAELPDLSMYDLKDKKCIFVDDSLHSARTLNQTVFAVKNNGGTVVSAYFGFVSGSTPYVQNIKGILDIKEMRNGY